MPRMRAFLLRSAVLITLAAILGGQVTELFDRWDHTLQTGKDTDYSVVLVAACAGLAFLIAKTAIPLFRRVFLSRDFLPTPPSPHAFMFAPAMAVPGPSPPPLVSLRI